MELPSKAEARKAVDARVLKYDFLNNSRDLSTELEALLKEADKTPVYGPSIDFSLLGVDLKTCYGGFDTVTRRKLEGREYVLEKWDGKVSVFFTDALHWPPASRRSIMISELED